MKRTATDLRSQRIHGASQTKSRTIRWGSELGNYAGRGLVSVRFADREKPSYLERKIVFWWRAVHSLDRVSGARVSNFWSGRSLADFCFAANASLSPFRADALVECYTMEDMGRFIASRDSLPTALRGFVMPYSPETYVAKEARLFLTIDGRGGFALIADELASLFSLPGAGYGDLLVQSAVKEGASKLSCFDNKGKLVSLYSRHGFKETNRFAWNDELAPQAWDYAAWGRPDYVEMSR